MKLHSIVIALVASTAFGAAAAQEATPDTWLHATSTASRADVQADAVAALHAGEVQYGEVTRFVEPAVTSMKTRAQVTAEAREAMRLGVLGGGEVTTFATPAQLEQIRLAGERVRADTPLASAR